MDASHACDFRQVEGIVVDTEINFRTLLGLLKLFAIEVARSDEVRFTPAYFPFTEPSVEAHIRHPDLGWMELGGAGIFRDEVTSPFGIGFLDPDQLIMYDAHHRDLVLLSLDTKTTKRFSCGDRAGFIDC